MRKGVLQDHFNSLPAKVAKEKREEFHQLTIEMSRGLAENLHEFGEPRKQLRTNQDDLSLTLG